MAIWTEPRTLSIRFHKDRFAATVQMGETKDHPCRIEFQEYIGEKPLNPLGWRPSPENTLVLSIPGVVAANNLAEGKALANSTLTDIASGQTKAVEKRPYVKAVAEPVRSGKDASGLAQASVVKWADDKYEIVVALWAPDAAGLMPMATPQISSSRNYSWCRFFNEHIYANTAEEANDVVRRSFEEAVALAKSLAEKSPAENRKGEA